jgi:transposase
VSGQDFRHFGLQGSPQSGSEDGPDRRVELITGRMRRRSWTDAEKAAIVAECLEPGVQVTAVAHRHRITRGLLWEWRRQMLGVAGDKAGAHFVPLLLAAEPEEPHSAIVPDAAVDRAPHASGGAPAGLIEIEVGRARVRVQGSVDLQALREVLVLIERRS